MRKPRVPPELAASRGSRALLYAYASIIILLVFVVGLAYRGDLELKELAGERRVDFERNIAEQGAALTRVVFALEELLVAAAGEGWRVEPAPLAELGRSLVNHARIPMQIEPSSLEGLLGDDPLFLAERLEVSNRVYESRIGRLESLLDAAEAALGEDLASGAGVASGAALGKGEAQGGPAALAALEAFLAEVRVFLPELKERSALSMQVAGAYHAANRANLAHIDEHIGWNLVELSALSALLVLVSVLIIRARLAAERELKAHKARLEAEAEVRNEELGAANESLLEALAAKDVLIKEIHHRVKNNLSMVASLISLQRDYAGPGAAEGAFEKLGERIQAISLIHEKLYRSADLSRISFGDYAAELVESLRSSLCADPEAVALDLEFEEARFAPDLLLPLGLVVTELVTNSLKHAFGKEGRGRIRLSLAPAGEEWLLEVGDDGTPPADPKAILESSSLGSVLVQSLVKQVKGSLALDLSGGTNFAIRFPRNPAEGGA